MCKKHKYNEQGYCRFCGERSSFDGRGKNRSLSDLGAWPVGTWFQKQLALVRVKELQRVSGEGSNSHA
jgi:hypothetical protein